MQLRQASEARLTSSLAEFRPSPGMSVRLARARDLVEAVLRVGRSTRQRPTWWPSRCGCLHPRRAPVHALVGKRSPLRWAGRKLRGHGTLRRRAALAAQQVLSPACSHGRCTPTELVWWPPIHSTITAVSGRTQGCSLPWLDAAGAQEAPSAFRRYWSGATCRLLRHSPNLHLTAYRQDHARLDPT